MIFNPTTRTRKWVGATLAAGILGASTVGGVTAIQAAGATQAAAAVPASTVPKSLTRAETAAEDVIGYLEQAQPAKSKSEARVLKTLAHGDAAKALRKAGVSRGQIAKFQQRADRTAQLSRSGASALKVSQAANSVSQLMPGFYSRYHDPVPAAVLKLDYLDRQVQLDARAGDNAKLRTAIAQLEATWKALRPQLVKAGGSSVARSYDKHVVALKGGGAASAVQTEAAHGLDVVDKMEAVFLGK
jgi:hypothetical protein